MTNPIRDGQDMMVHLADALDLASKLPPSREAALVKTKIDEAIMWGNRALCGLHVMVNETSATPNA